MIDFINQAVGSTTIEYIAIVCGLLNVGLLIRRSIWNYLFGFIMVVLYAKIFYDYKLYSDSLLQIFFFVTQLYGLYYWLRHKAPDGKVVVDHLSSEDFSLYLGYTFIFWVTLSGLMWKYTDAAVPFWDGSIAALSVTAQILLMRRHYQSWMLWIAVDVLAIGLFYHKGLVPTAALYFVFLILASIGLITWKKAYDR